MRYCVLFFFILFRLPLFSASNTDSAFISLKVVTLIEGRHKPVAYVLVQASLDIYPYTMSGYTNKEGLIAFNIPTKADYVFLKTAKEGHCFTKYFDSYDTIRISSSISINDTIEIFAIAEEIAVIYPKFYFEKNSSILNLETYNHQSAEILQHSDQKLMENCGIKILSFSDCEEKDNHNLAVKRAATFFDYLKKYKITSGVVLSEIHSGIGCGCNTKEECQDEDRSGNRYVRIEVLR